MKDYNLIVHTEELERKGEYTYYNGTLKVYSFIDLCVSTKEIVSNMINVYIMDYENYFSDHRAFCFQFEASYICNSQFERIG